MIVTQTQQTLNELVGSRLADLQKVAETLRKTILSEKVQCSKVGVFVQDECPF